MLQELTRQNGEGIAQSILNMSEMHTCPDPDRFVASLRDMFESLDPEVIRTKTSEVLQDMIEQLRQHQVGSERVGSEGVWLGRMGGQGVATWVVHGQWARMGAKGWKRVA